MLRQYIRNVSPPVNARSRVVISEAVAQTSLLSRPQEVRSRNFKAISLLKNLGGTNRVDI